MRDYLPKSTRKAFVQLEFIVDKDGVPVNFKVIRGGVNEDFNDELISRIEATMATWQPALLMISRCLKNGTDRYDRDT